MAFSATFAMDLGLLSKAEHTRLLKLFSRAGLTIDHELFNNMAIEKGTAAILKTRDGQLRLAVPGPLGTPKFVNDFTVDGLQHVLEQHKQIVAKMPRKGVGIQAYVDVSDTGEGDINELVNGEKPSLDGGHPILDGNSRKEILVNGN